MCLRLRNSPISLTDTDSVAFLPATYSITCAAPTSPSWRAIPTRPSLALRAHPVTYTPSHSLPVSGSNTSYGAHGRLLSGFVTYPHCPHGNPTDGSCLSPIAKISVSTSMSSLAPVGLHPIFPSLLVR